MILQLVSAFLGTAAFALLFSVPKEQYVLCGVIGAVGWAIYLALTELLPLSPAEATFFATAVVIACSKVSAVKRHCPGIVFSICGIFPLIPGGTFYRCVSALVIGDGAAAQSAGVLTAKIIFALVLGIVVIQDLPERLFRGKTEA